MTEFGGVDENLDSNEDRIRAVKLYMRYARSVAHTIRELGYPSRGMLVR